MFGGFESPPTPYDTGDLWPRYASNRVPAAKIWFNGTQTVQTANANTRVGSRRWPRYGSNSGHFMVQVTIIIISSRCFAVWNHKIAVLNRKVADDSDTATRSQTAGKRIGKR